MRKKILIQLLIVAFLSFGIAGMAQAAIATWIFAPVNGTGAVNADLGADETFTDTTSGFNIPLTAAAGAIGAAPFQNLYAKQILGDPLETGLGLVNTVAHEIDSNHFIVLDTADMKFFGASDLTLGIGSEQTGEGYRLFGGNSTDFASATFIQSNTSVNPDSVNITDGTFTMYRYFFISATDPLPGGVSDVLILNGATSNVVPIPGAVVLLGSGLVGLAVYARSRKYLKS